MRPSEVAEMMIVTHVDELERRSVIQVPEGTPETRWGQGILVGPPDLSALGLPEEVTTRLHNELFHRGIVRRGDAKLRRPEVQAALSAALRIDVEHIITLYEENANG
jgi:hypothetical protein